MAAAAAASPGGAERAQHPRTGARGAQRGIVDHPSGSNMLVPSTCFSLLLPPKPGWSWRFLLLLLFQGRCPRQLPVAGPVMRVAQASSRSQCPLLSFTCNSTSLQKPLKSSQDQNTPGCTSVRYLGGRRVQARGEGGPWARCGAGLSSLSTGSPREPNTSPSSFADPVRLGSERVFTACLNRSSLAWGVLPGWEPGPPQLPLHSDARGLPQPEPAAGCSVPERGARLLAAAAAITQLFYKAERSKGRATLPPVKTVLNRNELRAQRDYCLWLARWPQPRSGCKPLPARPRAGQGGHADIGRRGGQASGEPGCPAPGPQVAPAPPSPTLTRPVRCPLLVTGYIAVCGRAAEKGAAAGCLGH